MKELIGLNQAAIALDIRLSEVLWGLPKRGGTDLQKGMRKRLQVEVQRIRELRRYIEEELLDEPV